MGLRDATRRAGKGAAEGPLALQGNHRAQMPLTDGACNIYWVRSSLAINTCSKLPALNP